jgi:phosphatidylserine/phosphatidylglycerophosphate/cardiolipin synthase-like enzyme
VQQHEIDTILARTLDDSRLSRAERQALDQLLAEIDDPRQLDLVRARAFALVREQATCSAPEDLLEWLEDVVRAVEAARGRGPTEPLAEAWFSPGDACRDRLVSLLGSTRHCADICVFTISDNRLAEAIVQAHQRGVAVRVISDDLKAGDMGSDIRALGEAGVAVAFDDSPAHMHHKFAVFDRRVVATGSYNWTRSAATQNFENLVVCDQPSLVRRFADEFERLWRLFRLQG